MMNKPLAIADKPFRIMNVNTSKEKSFYTQGQQFATRVLFTFWLLASVSPESALAAPARQHTMVPATTNSPGDPSLSSAPPTPPPGPFWGGSVASSPSIDAALQRQPAASLRARTIDKLVARFWSPRPQTVPRTPAGPVAEGVTEGSSVSAPSALEQLMSGGIPDNNTLVLTLNTATPQEQHRWLAAAIQWFTTHPIEALTPAATRDYAALAHIRVTPTNSKLLKHYFHSLCDKVKKGSSGEELPIQALAYALAHLDPIIFEGDSKPLLDLGTNLLAKLNPSQRELKQADYPSARATLEALSQTLFLVHEVAPKNLNVREGSLYQSFQSRLQEITDRAQYYPITYHASILKQTLRLLKGLKTEHKSNFRRVLQGLLGAANLVAVGQGLAIGELQPTESQAGVSFLKKAVRKHRIEQKPWYSTLLVLEERMLACLQDPSSKAYPEPAALEARVQSINMSSLRLKDIATTKVQQYRQALRFGIAMQLQTLALQGPTSAFRKVRKGSIERLITLGQPRLWGSDGEVMTGLLDSLALVAVQRHQERSSEASMARTALERLVAISSATHWLSGEKLAIKLQRLREQANQYMPSCEERLFSQVKAMLQLVPVSLVRQVQEGLDKVLEAIQIQNENQPPSNCEQDHQALRAHSQQVERRLSEVRHMLHQGAQASLTSQQLQEGLDQVLQAVKVPKEATSSAAILEYSQKIEELFSDLKRSIEPSHPSLTSQQFQERIEKLIHAIQGQRPVYGSEGSSLTRQSSEGLLRAQIAAGKSPEEVYPLIAKRLEDPKKIFPRSDQIRLLTDCVRYGRVNAEAMAEKDAVIVLGKTGVGKSTLINYLAGCELKEQWVEGQLEPTLEVRGTSSGGERDEVTPIGHEATSKTFMPQIVAVNDQVYCDCPGFSDNRGAEINIANAVNIKQALSRARSLRMVVLVNYHSLFADRRNVFRDLLRTLTDLLGSEAAIVEHKGSILLGISKCFRPNMTCKKLWEGIANYVPESLSFFQDRLFLFNPLSPEAGWDRAGCLAALDRLAKVPDPSSILSVPLNDGDLYALQSLVDAMGEEIAAALSGGDLSAASARYRSLDRLSVIDHEKMAQLLSSTRARIASWLREQEDKLRFQYTMHDFTGAERLLSALRDASTSLGASEVDLSSLRAELDSARETYEVQQAQVSALEGELSSLREALSENANKVESNHAEVLNLFEQQQASISEQLKPQESAFGRRMELLEGQLRTQQASYAAKLEEIAASHKSERSRREAEIRQEVQLNAEEQAAALAALQQELETCYQSEQQAQEARHSQAVALLAAEKSAAEQALHTENRKVIADQERLLLDQQQAYKKLLRELKDSQSANQTLSAKNLALQVELQEHKSELQKLKSSLPKSPSGVVTVPQTPPNAISPYRPELSPAVANLASSQTPPNVISPHRPELSPAAANLSSPQTPPNIISPYRPELSPAAANLSSLGDSVLDASVWERYYGPVGSSPSLPSGISQVMNSPCPFWRGKQVKETHLLALIPSRVGGQPLTLDYLGELIKSPKGGGHKTQYRGSWDKAREAIGSQSPGSSYWVLMTRDVLEESRSKSYQDQCALVAALANRTGLAYEVPGALEAAVVTLLHHVRSGERLYSDNPYTYTRCRDKYKNGYQLVVGGFSSGGLNVYYYNYGNYNFGVSSLRKF